MQFYKFEGIITNPDWTEENDKRHILRERARKICLKTTSFNQTLKGQSCFYVTDASDNIFHAGIISQESSELSKEIQAYLKTLKLSVDGFASKHQTVQLKMGCNLTMTIGVRMKNINLKLLTIINKIK